VMVFVMAFHRIGHIVVVTVRVHIVRNAIPIGIHGYQSKVSVGFIDIVQTVVVGIDQTWGQIVRYGLGFHIVRDTVIVTVDVQVIRDAVPIGVGGIGGRVVVPIQVEVFKVIQDTVPIRIHDQLGVDDDRHSGRATISMGITKGVFKAVPALDASIWPKFQRIIRWIG